MLVPALIDNSVRLWPFQGKLESLFLPGRTVIEETLPGRVLRRVLRRPLRAKTYIESRREFGSNLLRPEQGTGLPLIITAEFTATEQWLNRGNIASSCPYRKHGKQFNAAMLASGSGTFNDLW